MKHGPDIVTLAALIGDPARANILTALMAGHALTASELAAEAGVTPQTVSAHLNRLEDGALIRRRKQGRHAYVELAGPEVAQALEGLMGLAASTGQLRSRPGPRDAALRQARVCYDHLAGDLGVQMFAAMSRQGALSLGREGLVLTHTGAALMGDLGIDLTTLPRSRAPLCRECLDWSARQSHLAGRIGRAMLARFETLGWMVRQPGSRALRVPQNGLIAFNHLFPQEETRL